MSAALDLHTSSAPIPPALAVPSHPKPAHARRSTPLPRRISRAPSRPLSPSPSSTRMPTPPTATVYSPTSPSPSRMPRSRGVRPPCLGHPWSGHFHPPNGPSLEKRISTRSIRGWTAIPTGKARIWCRVSRRSLSLAMWTRVWIGRRAPCAISVHARGTAEGRRRDHRRRARL